MSKKKIWIMNHYATNMYFNEGGRHYWFAENLIKQGYEPTIFCANVRHNSNDVINMNNSNYIIDSSKGIPFVFVKTLEYKGNGKKRIFNMISFYRNLLLISKKIAKKIGKPDIILASSVHPLTLVAGIKIAKIFSIPCICEVRDLWPETLVAMDKIKKDSILAKLLYKLERFAYKKADKLIFTFPGGKEYVESIGLDSSKVNYINNGVDIEKFIYNKHNIIYEDKDLKDDNYFKIIYTGSMGQANELSYLIKSAKRIKENNINNIKFILFGDGYQRQELELYAKNNNLNNIIFKGKVEKKYIPNILSKSNLNIFTGKNIYLYKYGLSLNKMFDYFASGKPTLSNIECGYDSIEEYNCGITVKGGSVESLVEGILKFYNMDEEEYNKYGDNALKASENFDFKKLTDKLEKIIIS